VEGVVTVVGGRPLVVVIDVKQLRRACLASFFSGWAESRGLELMALDPSEILEELCGNRDCRTIIFSLGSDSVVDAETSKRIRALRALMPSAPLVGVSDNEAPGEIVAAVEIGAVGFLSTNVKPDLASRALSFILDGGSYIPSSAIGGFKRQLNAAPISDNGNGSASGHRNGNVDCDDDTPTGGMGNAIALTARQQEVLELLQLGNSNKLIARQLGMSEATVKVHVRHIMRKLGAANRIQAALSAVSPGSEPGLRQPHTSPSDLSEAELARPERRSGLGSVP
jgi:DNA-binding NarL/FixJ family response regulator